MCGMQARVVLNVSRRLVSTSFVKYSSYSEFYSWVYTRAVEEVVEGEYLLRDEVGTVCGRRDVELVVGVLQGVCSCWFEIVCGLH